MKKVCKVPFERVYIMPNGNVFVCSSTTKPIGNILKNTLEEIWNGEVAEKVRESINNQSFEYCKASCPFCENDSLKKVSDENYSKEIESRNYPVQFNIACDYTCNHSCPSCRPEVFVGDETYHQNVEKIIENIVPYINQYATFLSTDGQGDLFASKHIMNMLSKIKPQNKDIKIVLETNAVLFDEEHWERIKHLGDYYMRVVITPNSFDRITYKALSGGHDNLERLIGNLRFVKKLRENESINELSMSIVVQDRNFRELPSFVERSLEEFGADQVSIKPIYKWFKLTEDEYWIKDILNPLNPYHQEYMEVWEDERLKDKRIFWWGAKNIHECKENPAKKWHSYFNLTKKWIETYQSEKKFLKYFEERNYAKVGIYGYGVLGKLLEKELLERGILECVIDQRVVCPMSVKAYRVNEELPDMDCIVITPFLEFEKIKELLLIEIKSCDIISIQDIFE